MKHLTSRSHLIFIVLAQLLFAAPLFAGNTQPFHASGAAFFVELDPPSALYVAGGQATHLGDFEAGVERRIKHGTSFSRWILYASGGDSLFISTEATFDPEAGVLVGTYRIEGGTGRFAGASGSGDYTATLPGDDGSIPFSMDGTISY